MLYYSDDTLEKMERELERVEIWLSQHLLQNMGRSPETICIPTGEIVEIYRLISYTLENEKLK